MTIAMRRVFWKAEMQLWYLRGGHCFYTCTRIRTHARLNVTFNGSRDKGVVWTTDALTPVKMRFSHPVRRRNR